MNCELVKALLHAYLDNELALDGRQGVTSHLQSCAACSTLLADFRRFDELLSRLPHAEPRPSLRDRIFSSTEYKNLIGTSRNTYDGKSARISSGLLFDDSRYSRFISLPSRHLRKTSEVHRVFVIPLPYRRSSLILRIMQITIVTGILLTLSVSGFIGYRLWQKQVQPPHTMPTILQYHHALNGHNSYHCSHCDKPQRG
jgi:hypothetical protein